MTTKNYLMLCELYHPKLHGFDEKSDPNIFGHPENINLLKDRSYLAEQQFLWWDLYEYNPEAFVKPEEVLKFL